MSKLKNLKNNGKFHSLGIYKKPLFFQHFWTFLKTIQFPIIFSQLGHNLHVSNAHIIPYYFLLLDLFMAGKFWQLRTGHLSGIWDQNRISRKFSHSSKCSRLLWISHYLSHYSVLQNHPKAGLVQFFHGLESSLLQYQSRRDLEFKQKNAIGWALETHEPEQFAWISFFISFF